MQSFGVALMPVKSSLSKYRAKISSLFFKDILEDLLNSFNGPRGAVTISTARMGLNWFYRVAAIYERLDTKVAG